MYGHMFRIAHVKLGRNQAPYFADERFAVLVQNQV